MDDPEKMMQNCVLNVCQPGSSLLASGYCLYSSSTVLVLTIGHGVFGFTYDSQIGEFVLSHPDMKARRPAHRPRKGTSAGSHEVLPAGAEVTACCKPFFCVSH